MEDYIPYGKEWEASMNKLPKKEIIAMLRKHHTGTTDNKACGISSIDEAQNFVEGCINDFVNGLSESSEFRAQMGEYTARLMHMFWENAKKRIKENPLLLEEKAIHIG